MTEEDLDGKAFETAFSEIRGCKACRNWFDETFPEPVRRTDCTPEEFAFAERLVLANPIISPAELKNEVARWRLLEGIFR